MAGKRKNRADELAVFIDANIAVHAEPFESQDWHQLTGRRASKIVLVVCGGVLKEVDDLATDERRAAELQERARRRRLAIRNAWRNPGNLPKNVTLELWSLSAAGDRDSDVLRSVEQWKRSPALVATNDIYLSARAHAAGIETLGLPERAPVTTRGAVENVAVRLDSLQNRLTQLEAALSRGPVLTATFQNGTRECVVVCPPAQPLTTTEHQEIRRAAERELVRRYGSVFTSQQIAELNRDIENAAERTRTQRQREAGLVPFTVRMTNESETVTADDVRVAVRVLHVDPALRVIPSYDGYTRMFGTSMTLTDASELTNGVAEVEQQDGDLIATYRRAEPMHAGEHVVLEPFAIDYGEQGAPERDFEVRVTITARNVRAVVHELLLFVRHQAPG